MLLLKWKPIAIAARVAIHAGVPFAENAARPVRKILVKDNCLPLGSAQIVEN